MKTISIDQRIMSKTILSIVTHLCAALADESLHDRQSSARADRSQWGGKLALSAVAHVLDD